MDNLEIREGGRLLAGRFPYGKMATVADRGKSRKERIESRAFSYAIEDAKRDINLLSGHQFSMPLASRKAQTLTVVDSDEALDFEATLPPEAEQPTWMRDTVLAVRSGLFTGISPGFKVPPLDVVPDAEVQVPEEGNPGVYIRSIKQAVLYEISLVSRAAYDESEIENRGNQVIPGNGGLIWPLKVY